MLLNSLLPPEFEKRGGVRKRRNGVTEPDMNSEEKEQQEEEVEEEEGEWWEKTDAIKKKRWDEGAKKEVRKCSRGFYVVLSHFLAGKRAVFRSEYQE